MTTVFSEFGMRTTRLIPGRCEWDHAKLIEVPVIDVVTKVDPVGYWLSQSNEELKTNCDLMKIYMLWQVLISKSGGDDQLHHPWVLQVKNMKDLDYIELLEDLGDLFKKVASRWYFVDDILRIGNKMDTHKRKTRMAALVDAINWVQDTGDQAVYKKIWSAPDRLRSLVLFTFFFQYSFLLTKMGEECCTLTDKVKKHACDKCDEECDRKKICGNVAFEKEQYISAVQYYTAAMQYSPHNHILFGNRALCFIRMGDYWSALCDGKKAVVLKNTWPKGHYRFCEALFLLGETERAVSSNKKAQELCRYSPDGIRDLVQQQSKFIRDMEEAAGIKVKKNSKKKSGSEKKIAAHFPSAEESKDDKEAPSKSEDTSDKESTTECSTETKECTENVTAQQPKKGKLKGKGNDSEKLRVSSLNTETQRTPSPGSSQVDLATVQDTVKSLVREAYEALNDKRCRNAEGIFSKLLDMLEKCDLQSLNLTKLDYLVLQYGHAIALLGIGQCVELVKAENQFKGIIQHHSKEKFNCLAFYGIGNVYFRQNRFSEALNQFIKSKTMVNHKMVPGVLTWPTTSVVIEETRPEKLQVLLDNCIEECKFPPKPDAICRYEQCLSLPKAQIYFSDPDFKGFIRMVCCHFCRVEFHVCCWKKMKAMLYSDKNDKDFLKYTCLTPDCRGFIFHIVIFDSIGQVKCEFEDKSVKKKDPQKPTVKHKATSNKSNKIKYENKSERKKAIEEECIGNPDDPRKQPPETILSEAVGTNGYRLKWDPLLAQVLKKEGLIKRGCPVSFPSFWDSVCVWRIISQEKLEEMEKNSSSQSFSKMKGFLTYLYTLHDRVKTRIFLYLLFLQKEHITVNLHDWLLIVNNKGLEASVEFRDRNRERLKNINPETVVNLWNETYGKNINYMITDYSSSSVFDFLTSMNIEGFRCFLWLLEENKHITSECGLEKELEKYFQEMDIPRGQVPKQSFENYNNNCMNLKIKHKKKKRNQPVKPTYKLSGAVSTRSPDEDIFTEENTLSLLDPNEPFLIPESLRSDVDEFEALYELGLLTDSEPELVVHFIDPIQETLYEYFYQILDEYGPLKPDDERLIGEYKDFPEETQKMVEAAGSLKNFLLQSDEFTIVDDMIALSLTYNNPFREHRANYPLNPTAEEFKPSFTALAFNNAQPYGAAGHDDYMSADPGATECSDFPVYSDLDLNYRKFAKPFNSPHLSTLPDTDFGLTDNQSFERPVLDEDLDEVHSYTSNGSSSMCDYYEDDDDDTAPEPNTDRSQDKSYVEESDQMNYMVSSKNEIRPKNIQTAIVSVQVDIDYSHHEVNTEPFQPFETQQGDILRMEKEHTVLQDQLQEATEKYENLQRRYQEEIAGLEEQIKNTVESNKIAKTELVWLQQEYENETKKWLQERKENQEKLKRLKSNIKTLTESNDRYSKGIVEKKKQYEAYIKDFAKIHCSKFENEKAKLENHIAKSEAEREAAAQRAAMSEVMVLENQKQAELLRLRLKASNAEQSIKMLKPAANSNPVTLEQINTMGAYVSKLKIEMDKLQSEFDGKINALKKNAKMSPTAVNVSGVMSLPTATVFPESSAGISAPLSSNPGPSPIKPSNPVPVKSPVNKTAANKKAKQKSATKPQTHPASNSVKPKTPAPSPAKGHGATGTDRRGNGPPDSRPPPSAKPTLFDKIIEELHDIFPHYKSAELTNFIKDFRVRNSGTLSGLSQEDIICRVTEYILDYQAKSPPPPASPNTSGLNMSNLTSGIMQPSPPQPKQPWRVVTGGAKVKWQNSNDLESFGEDPCIICHDELKQFPVHKLDCGHYFHKHCIKTWLHTQSTCPTCREHALLPEDFPVLSGRMRTA